MENTENTRPCTIDELVNEVNLEIRNNDKYDHNWSISHLITSIERYLQDGEGFLDEANWKRSGVGFTHEIFIEIVEIIKDKKGIVNWAPPITLHPMIKKND